MRVLEPELWSSGYRKAPAENLKFFQFSYLYLTSVQECKMQKI